MNLPEDKFVKFGKNNNGTKDFFMGLRFIDSFFDSLHAQVTHCYLNERLCDSFKYNIINVDDLHLLSRVKKWPVYSGYYY